jgi:hypothetical protein
MSFAIFAVLPSLSFPFRYCRNGIPSASAAPAFGVGRAVVVMEIFMPLVFSTLL